MDVVKQRTMELLKILRDNGFDIRRIMWEECGSGEWYEEYQVIDTKNNNVPITGTGEEYANLYKELKSEVKSFNYKGEPID